MKNNKLKIGQWLIAGLIVSISVLFASCEDTDEAITGIVPVATNVNPTENIRPGAILTITGEKLDHVKELRFGSIYLIGKANFASQTATQITVILPEEAPGGDLFLIAEDDVVPNQLAAAVTTLQPTISAIDPLEIEVGGQVRVSGTNLDLVNKVQVGNVDLEIIESSNTELIVKFPDNLLSGGLLKFIKLNKEEVVFDTPVAVIIPAGAPEVTVLPESIKPGEWLKAGGNNLDQITQIFFGDIVATEFGFQNEFEINVKVPQSVPTGTCIIKFQTATGLFVEKEILIEAPSGSVETTVFTGPYELDWGATEIRLNKELFADLAAGSILKFYYTSIGNTQVKFQDANWGGIDISSDPNASATDNAVLELPSTGTSYEVTLTAAMLNTILTVDDGWGPTGLIFKGQGGTISKITIK